MTFLTCLVIAFFLGLLIFGEDAIVFVVVALPPLMFVGGWIIRLLIMRGPELALGLGVSWTLFFGHWIGEQAFMAIKRGYKLLPSMMIDLLCKLLPPMIIDIGAIHDT